MDLAVSPFFQLLLSMIDRYQGIIISLLILVNFVFLLLFLLERRANRKFRRQYLELLAGIHTDNVEELILKHRDEVSDFFTRIEALEKTTATLERKLASAVQKVGMVRYNAFQELGSDQSFSLALLNSQDDGVVLTSIFGRDECRLFAKPVKKGQSRYRLTDEELLALDRAKQDPGLSSLLAYGGEEGVS